jgi:hypothetical protein
MKKLIITLGMLAAVAGLQAQTAFTPGRLAVLRTGSPQSGSYNPALDWNSKQNPDYIDEFNPNVSVPTAPTYTEPLPTNGPNSIWNNGNAGSEADSMGRSADRSILTYSAYTGDILSLPGTPSSLPYHRIISVIDPFGTNYAAFVGDNWYGIATGKTNPRGVVSDGTNNFWGSGNNGGTLFYSPNANDGQPVGLQNFTPTRAVKIINNTVYTTITGKDSLNAYPSGIYDFVQFDGVTPNPLPTGFAGFHLVVPSATKYTNISGFYMNDAGTIAYMADQAWGVQKYVKTGGTWQFQCNYNVQGYEQTKTSFTITNDVKNSIGGAWDVVADFSGTNPVIYATTCDYAIYSGNFNSNRVVRIVDTNTTFSASDITNFTVIAQAYGTNVAFRAIDFTPDLRPVIASVSGNQAVVNGSSANFSVSAWESYMASTNSPISYQWYENDSFNGGIVPISLQTNATLTLTGSDVGYQDAFNHATGIGVFCVVSNNFGALTSAPPATLYVTGTAVAPTVTNGGQHLTNAIGDTVSITVNVSGNATTPLSYQWYAGNPATGGTQLSDMNEYTNTATQTLTINSAQIGLDDTNYYCIVTNSAGSVTNLIATLKLVYTPPVFSSSPSSVTVLSNTAAAFSCTVFGSSPSYQWYTSNKVAIAGATLSSLTINPATTNQGYFVVVTNLGGAITSAVATVTVIIPPPYSFVNYTNAGQLYVQTFDSLPVITNTTVNTGNPVTFLQDTNKYSHVPGGSYTYSVADPFDFAFPVITSGGVGGLGLTNTMQGWYGWGGLSSKLGAHQGDQSTGGIIDYGDLTNVNSGELNRALGLQSTSTTSNCAFGLKLINNSSNTLTQITLSYVGELWRNQPGSNDIVFGYYIDTTGTNSTFQPTNSGMVFVPSMNVSFQTNAGGELTLDGSNPTNQINLAITNLAITGGWPSNAALWLVWQQLNSPGSQQGEAIDNVSFSATSIAVPTVTTLAASNITAGSALLSGSVNPNGGMTAYWFQYGTNTSYGSFTVTNSTSTNGAFGITASNLLQGRTYHFQLVGTNSAGTGLGADQSFSTIAVTAPQFGSSNSAIISGGGTGPFNFSFTNAPGATFTVLGTTNVALPIGQWSNLGTATEVSPGNYQFSDPNATSNPAQFYILRAQ